MERVLQISDTHEGLTKRKFIDQVSQKISQEEFDILLHNGDYSGGSQGHKLLRSTVEIIRKHNPDVPFVSNIGNHDYWCRTKKTKKRRDLYGRTFRNPTRDDYETNYSEICKTFKDYGVHFLDEDGPFRFGGCVIFGHSGWYHYPGVAQHSNDFNLLPLLVEGDTHRWMQKKAQDGLYRNIDLLTEADKQKVLCYSSHFPVIKTPRCNNLFEILSGSISLGEWLKDDIGVRYFFCGHAHQLHKGPLRWESGSDYFHPRYHIVEVKAL